VTLETRKDLVFALLSVVFTVPIMMSYNMILTFGFSEDAVRAGIRNFIPLLLVAFIIQKFVVAHNVFSAYKVLVRPADPPLKHSIVMAFLWVTGMCFSLSLFATVAFVGTEHDFWQHWASAFLRNYPVAFAVQWFIVGPAVRNLHIRIFKPAGYTG
jgi:hypothetical protein